MDQPITKECWEVAGIDVPKPHFGEAIGGAGHYSLEKEKGARSKTCICRSELLPSSIFWSGNINFIATERQLTSKIPHYSWLQRFFSEITVFVKCELACHAKLRHLLIMHQYCRLHPGPACLQKQRSLVALRLEGPWCTVVFFQCHPAPVKHILLQPSLQMMWKHFVLYKCFTSSYSLGWLDFH